MIAACYEAVGLRARHWPHRHDLTITAMTVAGGPAARRVQDHYTVRAHLSR